MRLLGSLVFLFGALFIGAFAYFPHSRANVLSFVDIVHLFASDVPPGDNHNGDASKSETSSAVDGRTFSPGAHVFRVSNGGSNTGNPAKMASSRGHNGKTAMVADTGHDATQSATSRQQDAWRTGNDSSDVRRAAPKRNDYQARYELIRNLQTELVRVGCYGGDVDGDWGPGSKRAAGEFLHKVNATLPVDSPDYILLTLVQRHADKACGVDCPSGQALASNGRCVANVIVARAPERSKVLAQKASGAKITQPSGKAAPVATVALAAAAVQPALSTRATPRPTAPSKAKVITTAAIDTPRSNATEVDKTQPGFTTSVTRSSEAPIGRAAPLPGMMAIGAPATESPASESDALSAASVNAGFVPLPTPVQPASRQPNLSANQPASGVAPDTGGRGMRNRPSSAPVSERASRDANVAKTRRDKGHRRAREHKRDTVRSYAGKVRRGSPQYNLMLSLGGLF